MSVAPTLPWLTGALKRIREAMASGAGIDPLWSMVDEVPVVESSELGELQALTTRAMVVGALLAAGGVAAAGVDDAGVHEELAALRAALAGHSTDRGRAPAVLEARFGALGAAILRGGGVSPFIDMHPSNRGSDLVSLWLAGVMMLANRMSR